MEAAVRHRRLPGVYFEIVPRPVRDPLPRMDVAAFVGFAAAGPTDVPVSVEDVQQFRDIFGPPLRLLPDDGHGRPVFAQLYPAVELFFRNGGRRCWIVRVARNPHVRRFRLPGVVDSGSGRPTLLRARSGGTWADALRAHTVLKRRSLSVSGIEGHQDRLTINLADRPSEFAAGDVLHLFLDDFEVFIPAERVVETGETRTTVSGRPYWFKRHNERFNLTLTARTALALPDGMQPLPDGILVPTAEHRAPYLIRWDTPLPEPPSSGDMVHVTVSMEPRSPRMQTGWLTVSDINVSAGGAEMIASEALWPAQPTAAVIAGLIEGFSDAEPVAHNLRFDLYASGEPVGVQRLADVRFGGFEAEMQAARESVLPDRFWGDLPGDEDVFRATPHTGPRRSTSLLRDVLSPRFAFAAVRPESRMFIPLGMPAAFRSDGGLPAEALEGDAREQSHIVRNGLDAPFIDLFLDEEMGRQATAALEGRIFDRLYVRKQPLHGLHALWPLEEVATTALPDAAHEGFEWEPGGLPELLDAPHLEEPIWIREADTLRLVWTLPNGEDIRFEVHASGRPDFTDAPARYRTSDRQLELRVSGCSGQQYSRVRGRRGTEVGPWSNTVRLFSPPIPFERCRAALETPSASLIRDEVTNTFLIRWEAIEHAEDYEVVISSDVEMLVAEKARGPRHVQESEPGITILTQDLGPMEISAPQYVRVRAVADGDPGPWSRTLRIDPATRPAWRLRSEHDAAQAELLSIHRALIRLCGVRADCFAVLGLPKAFDRGAALEYMTAMKQGEPGASDVPAIRPDEGRLFSYAALYHPWAVSAIDAGDPIDVGTDGIAAGMYAYRTLRRGAWVAPAEMDLKGLLGLVDRFSDDQRVALRDAHVNTLIARTGRFTVSGAQTLSTDPEWNQVNVRRLMILLRRVLLREGNLFVFDSNDDVLRRRIAVRLEETLTDLFRRGAFAGRTTEEAFRIDASRSLNTPDQIDRGRLLVEIRIAPSRPLVFLVIRLVQRELEGLQISEV